MLKNQEHQQIQWVNFQLQLTKKGVYFNIYDSISDRAGWYKIDKENKSYLCIKSALIESGDGSSLSQYYIAEHAFDNNVSPVVYYYFFNKDIIPTDSEHF